MGRDAGSKANQAESDTMSKNSAQWNAAQTAQLKRYNGMQDKLMAGGTIAANPFENPDYLRNQNVATAGAVHSSNDAAKEALNLNTLKSGSNSASNKATIADLSRKKSRDMTQYTAGQKQQNYQNFLQWEQALLNGTMAPMNAVGGMYGTSVGGWTGANKNLADIQASQNEMWGNIIASGLQAAGTVGAGFAGKSKSGGSGSGSCWIASEFYNGWDTLPTRLVREYLNTEFTKHLLGRVVMALYRRFGKSVANLVRRNRAARAALRPLFDFALDRALIWKWGV